MRRRWPIFITPLVLTGCTPYELQDLREPSVEIPSAFQSPPPKVEMPEHWWSAFSDAGLNQTMEQAFAENLDLKQAWARLEQARATATIVGAPLYPEVNLDGSANRQRTESDDSVNYANRFRLGLALTWEIDLWQKIANRAEAARLLAQASRDDTEQTALLLSGTVVDLWLTIQEQEQLLGVLQDQIQASRDQLEVIELRYGQGVGDALGVLQQRLQLAQVESEIPAVAATLAVTRNQLAVVLGRPPQDSVEPMPEPVLPRLPGFPVLPTPRELLEQRPDLRASYKRLAASDLEVAASIADMLPTIRISLDASFNSPSLSSLFEDTVASMGGSLLQPVFDADRRGAEVDRRKAIMLERFNGFTEQFLVALREIEDAIDRELNQVRLLDEIMEQITIASSLLAEARFRYANGQTEYLDVISAIQSLQSVQRRAVTIRKQLLSNRAQLYLALGGDWLRSLQPGVGLTQSAESATQTPAGNPTT
ncbi:MAG: TolC family protein [Planctomycetota bacterium]|nr:TolC family protein [Planctomycetota bacterium]